MIHVKSRRQILQELNQVVANAAAYLSTSDESLSDGDQTAHQVLSHLVFWHREHATVIHALAQGHVPKLRIEKYYELNREAYQEFQDLSMRTLARRLPYWQRVLENAARCMPAVGPAFAFRQGSKPQSLDYWLPKILAHIDGHVIRLQRVERKKKKALRTT